MGLEGIAQEEASRYVLYTKYYPGDQIKNKLDRSCSTYGAEEVHTGFWWGNLRERDHLEDQDREEKLY